jgi:hypothetical protein
MEARKAAPALAAALFLASCSGGSRDKADGADKQDDVGRLVVVAGGGDITVSQRDEFAGSDPTAVSLDGARAMAAGPGPRIWFLFDGGVVVKASDTSVTFGPQLPAITRSSDIAAGSDGAVLVGDSTRRQVVRERDAAITTVPSDTVTPYSQLAVGPDETVYVADPGVAPGDQAGGRIVAIGPDGSTRTVVEERLAGPMAVGPDGTLYYVRGGSRSAPYGVVSLEPGGEQQAVTGGDDHQPTDGGLAHTAHIPGVKALAATEHGLYILSENPDTEDVWRVAAGRLDLVLRRATPHVAMADIAAADGQVYVLDIGGHASAIEGAA